MVKTHHVAKILCLNPHNKNQIISTYSQERIGVPKKLRILVMILRDGMSASMKKLIALLNNVSNLEWVASKDAEKINAKTSKQVLIIRS